jgi:UV radiation resistance-associated gene protein
MAPTALPVDDNSAALASTDTDAANEEADGGDSPPASGSATPTKAAETPTTPTGTVRKSRGFLDLAPLSGFFKARYPSTSRGPVKADLPLEDEGAGEATPTVTSSTGAAGRDDGSSSADAPAAVTAQAETAGEGSSGGDDEDDDRRTIRASMSEEDGVEERKEQTKLHAGKSATDGSNGTAFGQHPAVGEKAVAVVRSPPTVVDGVS